MNEAETAGLGKVSGNWINNDVQYALEWPEFERNVEKAKQLMREAGYPNGFNVDWVTPLARVLLARRAPRRRSCRRVGIRAKLQTMERGVFFQRLQGGLKRVAGRADHHARRAHRRELVELVRRRTSSAAASTRATASA